MSDTPRWRRYLRFWGPDAAADVDDELRFHLEMRERDLIAAGMSPGDARVQAEREFGDVRGIRATCVSIDERQWRQNHRREVLDDMLYDLRHAARSLRRSPGFTLAAVVSLALGIGACTTIFSAMDALILRALPFPAVDRLVSLAESTRACDKCSTSLGDYAALRAQQRSAFSSVAAYREWSGTLDGPDGAAMLSGERVTPSFFSVLGVGAAIGRTFALDSAAPGQAHTVVLSDRLWRSRFGADPGVVGSTIEVSGEPYTVIGVMPPHFALGSPADLWLPLTVTAAQSGDYESHGWGIVARLTDAATLDGARSEVDVISREIVSAHPTLDQSTRLVLRTLSDDMLGELRSYFLPLLAAAGFVLLIVCANVANLLLVRASHRERELAMRAALGGTRWRLFSQLFAESALVAALGAMLGAVLARVAIPLLKHAIPVASRSQVPGWTTLALNTRALAFTAGLAMLCALVFGTLPALRASSRALTMRLKEGGRGATRARGGRTRSALVVTELTLAVVLLAGAGLMVRSFANLLGANTGLHAMHTLTVSIETPAHRYDGAATGAAVTERLRAALRAIPGVIDVAGAWNLPLSGTRNYTVYNVAGRPPLPEERAPRATDMFVTPGYFAALGIPLVRGRDFTARDDSAALRVAIVSQALARRQWPNESAVGQSIVVNSERYEIVGVAADVRNDGVEDEPSPAVYRATEQFGGAPSSLIIRAACARAADDCDPAALTAPIRRVVASVDPDIAIGAVRTVPQLVSDYLTPWRLLMTLLGAFAAVALVIAVVGIYGVMAYTVAQRAHEIGIRMALGADRVRVLRMVLRQATGLVAAGVLFGALGALGTTRALSSLLYGVSARDPKVLTGVIVLLALVALAASWIPARRAAKVDPVVAMRAE
ncbi:MAG TPA: ABC transporter permease [Gemmatimonadaceae bacterium]|nr:ABC transporter permease [Gemmatimonadaceae bacterium]